MNYKKNTLMLIFVAIFTLFSGLAVFAQDDMKKDDMKKDEMKKEETEDNRPIVAIIRADWCPYCQKVEPVISDLMKSYSEKLNFVAFDVTNEETTKEAKKKAESLGLGDFFKEFKGRTSAVAVLKDKKVVFKTSNNGKTSDYEKAFDNVLK